ncbi:MAG: glycosyltransferase family 4 protein, partial [Anaerolineales bacterium]
FVGDGKEKLNLIARSETMALQNVCFLPPVAKAEMPEVLAAADVCIAILKPVEAYKTTYPNKVFDYMAAGRAVVLAVDGVIREVVEDAGAGVFVPPGDSEALATAVNRLVADPEEGKHMGMAGRAYVTQHFNRPALAGKMERVMEAVHRGRGETE